MSVNKEAYALTKNAINDALKSFAKALEMEDAESEEQRNDMNFNSRRCYSAIAIMNQMRGIDV